MRAWLIVLLFCLSPAFAQGSGETVDLTGKYRVDGRNADGSDYIGQLTMSRNGDLYSAEWIIGGARFRGAGRLEGRVLTIQWEDGSDPVVYVLMPDGELHGTWADGFALDRLSPFD